MLAGPEGGTSRLAWLEPNKFLKNPPMPPPEASVAEGAGGMAAVSCGGADWGALAVAGLGAGAAEGGAAAGVGAPTVAVCQVAGAADGCAREGGG